MSVAKTSYAFPKMTTAPDELKTSFALSTSSLENKAIKAALEGNWKQAIIFNQEVLRREPQNISALNRLAKAFWKSGKFLSARKTYLKVISSDKYNPIALRNLQRLHPKKDGLKNNQKGSARIENKLCFSDLFLQEPGKTKSVRLLRLASCQTLSNLDIGEKVVLNPKKHLIEINREDGTYLGSLPEDLSYRLICLCKGGNRYEANVLSVSQQSLEIFIREVFRSQKFRNLPSFYSTSFSLNFRA